MTPRRVGRIPLTVLGLALLAALAAQAATAAASTSPQAPAPARQAPADAHTAWRIPMLDAARIPARCKQQVASLRQHLALMRQSRTADVLAQWNRLALLRDEFASVVYLLQNVSPKAATRDAAQACLDTLNPLSTEIFQDQRLYARVLAVAPRDAIERQYRQDLLDAFEDGGATLPPAARARAKQIADRIDTLALAFARTINEDKRTVAVTVAETEGMPASWLAARQRDGAGNVLVSLDYPSFVPFLNYAGNADARRRVWFAKRTEGGAENLARLDEAIALRAELATLHGQPDYATFSLRRQMAGTPQTVFDFLESVGQAVDEREAEDLRALRADKAAMLGLPVEQVTVDSWDLNFHSERIRTARYQVDQEALRAYFPTEAAVRFALRLSETLYGVRFVPRQAVSWHADVRVIDVYDDPGQGFVGTVYLDLFPREGKYNHAAAFGVRASSALAGVRPVSVLVVNLNREGLNQEEMVTLLHEFGHVMHGVLSRTRFADQGGTSVKRDFVEAPSQMFEEWARREQSLALLAQVCATCPRLSTEQIAQLESARRFGKGLGYGRQRLYARYDMAIHSGKPGSSLERWMALEGATRLGYIQGTLFPAGFGHLMSGYAAGYYGYLWSEVMAYDMLGPFEGRMLDPAVGRRYRDAILARGGEQPPQQLVTQFLGRPFTADAFFKELRQAP